MALSVAERQARYRERQARAAVQAGSDTGTILATLDTLTRAVEALAGEVRAMRMDGGQPRRIGGKTPDSVTSRAPNRDVTARPPARAREDGALPPTGVVAPLMSVTSNDDDAHLVLVTLTRPGSVGSIRDALGAIDRDLSLDRIIAALVVLQGRGLVQRTPGEGPSPDVWAAVQGDPALADLEEDAPRRVRPAPPESAHVTCSDYSAHSTLGHRWDETRQGFRCYVCDPAHVPQANPTGLGGTLAQEVH